MLTSYPVIPNSKYIDPLKYTLGPEDVVQIEVMRHPEFSGTYPINVEGKLQYKFVGDIDVDGLTKKELEDKIAGALSKYVVSPEVNVTVIEYKSKVIYVLGEVASPGKYYMRAESIPIREAVIQAGLPLQSAALRKCRIVTPTKKGLAKVKFVDLYAVLYGGRLNYNINLYAGDVLYVPCTIMAKVIRVISPVSTAVGLSSTPTQDVGAARKGQAVAEGRAVTY
ncbi:MAG TPA: polysaccharide biosynthesis/export family protein [Candidatus Margulisiibacteriota bacterium]|nr:polysaccharide biosynthesis/export family protein [Candidatus Margulisiibacteriota bacterium]